MNNILVTGCAGFIGFHLSEKLCKKGYNVVGIDNLNNYYDVNLKNKRLQKIKKYSNFIFHKIDISDSSKLRNIFENNNFYTVFHLAAQAGVRYSLENPKAYIDSNIIGFTNILECCKSYGINSLFYASSSSVYGECENSPFSERDNSIKPIAMYGVSKKFNEELAYSYYKLFNLNSIGLRFFTVYGPWGRPDMALYKFVDKIKKNKEIEVYNYGNHNRSFTYVDDIIESMELLWRKFYNKKKYYEIFNIGGDKSIKLMDYIKIIEKKLNKSAMIKFLPKQKGDIESTEADCSKLFDYINFKPKVLIDVGINNFIDWHNKYYSK